MARTITSFWNIYVDRYYNMDHVECVSFSYDTNPGPVEHVHTYKHLTYKIENYTRQNLRPLAEFLNCDYLQTRRHGEYNHLLFRTQEDMLEAFHILVNL